MNYYNEIKNKLIDEEIYSNIKDYSKEKHKVITYYEIGKLLLEAGNSYGEDIIGKYANKLMLEVDKKYSKRTLFRIRQFYIIFKDEKVSTMWTQLTWSHLRLLFSLEINPINYYISISLKNHISVKELETRIKSKEYERLPEQTKTSFNDNKDSNIEDYIKNPIMIKNNNNYEIISEKILQRIILEDLSNFMKELGNGFSYIDHEYKIKVEDRYNYIDLLLYNIKYKCYVVIELKVTELKKEHIGQIQVYMNYIDTNIKMIDDDKTIGIIICKKNNKFVMEYCSDPRILSKEYIII